MSNKKRVLIVDDSSFMRNTLKGIISKDPELDVIATAKDGADAVQKAAELKPDIITLDIEMPVMDGITAVRHIMKENPTRILIVSSLCEDKAKITLDALEAGAVDYVFKNLKSQEINIFSIESILIEKIKNILAGASPAAPQKIEAPPEPLEAEGGGPPLYSLVLIGVSTGGPKALMEVIPKIPKSFQLPIVIIQHMPAFFTKSFAERLNLKSELNVLEVGHGEPIRPGNVYIAPGGRHLRFQKRGAEVFAEIGDLPKNSLYKPSVNEAMVSAARIYEKPVFGVIMTGMGNDGCEGIRKIKEAGGKCLVQDRATSVVYGMPKAIEDAQLADKSSPLKKLAAEIMSMTRVKNPNNLKAA